MIKPFKNRQEENDEVNFLNMRNITGGSTNYKDKLCSCKVASESKHLFSFHCLRRERQHSCQNCSKSALQPEATTARLCHLPCMGLGNFHLYTRLPTRHEVWPLHNPVATVFSLISSTSQNRKVSLPGIK